MLVKRYIYRNYEALQNIKMIYHQIIKEGDFYAHCSMRQAGTRYKDY